MAEGDKKALHITVHGRVQGVGFRYSMVRNASKTDVTGWVRNRADGSVEILCEGKSEDIERFVKLVRKGPPGARVIDLNQKKVPYKGTYSRFTVEY